MATNEDNQIYRCPWCVPDPVYAKYHDEEWGRLVHDDARLFEFLVLEGAQAGLSWLTVLKKRDNYRRAFHNFDVGKVAAMTPADEENLMHFEGIIHNRLKIHSAVINARRFLEVVEEHGSFFNYVSSFLPEGKRIVRHVPDMASVPASDSISDALSRDLKKRGFKFVGTTICYSFLQGAGFIDDHLDSCHCKSPRVGKKNAVIFDLDGTLLNTIADLGNACNFALKEEGLPQHPLPDYNAKVGNGIRKLILRAAPDVSDEKREKVLHRFLSFYDSHSTDLTVPYPGIHELLRQLQTLGVKIAVCSNKYQRAVDKIIRFFFPDIRFAAVYGEREGIPRKPDPTVLQAVMAEIGSSAGDTVMVGDTEVDIEAARNAGIASVAVSWGFRSVENLNAASPDVTVDSPADILPLIIP